MAGNRAVYDEAMRRAEQHAQTQEWKGVIAAYKQALTEFPQDVAATVGIGQALVRVGQTDTALKALHRAVQLDASNIRALFALADIQERMGRLQTAANTYKQIGDMQFQEGNLKAAVDSWTRVIQLSPEQIDTYEKLGRTVERLGQTAKAEQYYTALVGIYERRRNLGAAIDACQEALRLNPHSQELQTRLMRLRSAALGQTGELKLWDEEELPPQFEAGPPPPNDEAFIGFDSLGQEEDEGCHSPYDQAQRRSLQHMANIMFDTGSEPGIRPEVMALIAHAIDEQTRGLFREAAVSLKRAINKGAAHAALIFNLGTLYYEIGDFDQAIEAFRSAMGDSDYALGAHYGLGLTYAAAGKVDRASEHFLEVIKSVDMETVDEERLAVLSAAYQRVKDNYIATVDSRKANTFVETVKGFFSQPAWAMNVPRARRHLDTVIEGDRIATLAEYLEKPETAITVDAIAVTDGYIRSNLLRTALEECLYAIERVPYNLSLHLRLGDVLHLQQQLPQSAAKYLTVADTYASQGEMDQAIGLYERAMKLTPMDADARKRLIQLLLRQKKTEEAIQQYIALADAYYQLAKLDQALKTYDDALSLIWKSPQLKSWEIPILYKKADIFNQRADWQGATATYEAIVAVDPDDARALRSIVDLYLKQRQSKRAMQTLDALLTVYQRDGHVQDIVSLLTELVEGHPADLMLRAKLAATYARLGYTEDAVEQAEMLARMQLKAGQKGDAIRTTEILRQLAPTESQRFRRLVAEIQAEEEETDT
jgi:tetratricopeptide (TPR) repeat protein